MGKREGSAGDLGGRRTVGGTVAERKVRPERTVGLGWGTDGELDGGHRELRSRPSRSLPSRSPGCPASGAPGAPSSESAGTHQSRTASWPVRWEMLHPRTPPSSTPPRSTRCVRLLPDDLQTAHACLWAGQSGTYSLAQGVRRRAAQERRTCRGPRRATAPAMTVGRKQRMRVDVRRGTAIAIPFAPCRRQPPPLPDEVLRS